MLFSFEALLHISLAIHRIATSLRKENFGQENFGKSFAIYQIHQDYLPPKFVSYGRKRSMYSNTTLKYSIKAVNNYISLMGKDSLG